ncbi:MAG: lipopolysaccharide kinase InaA family protein [Terriglobia bacterium]
MTTQASCVGSGVGVGLSGMRRRLLYAKSPAWAKTALAASELMMSPAFTTLKRTGRTHAGVYADGDTEFFIKRVMTGGWADGIAQRLRGSRAARTQRGAAILSAAGFACPRLLAAVEERSGGAIRASYVLNERLAQARMMSVFALAGGRNFRRRKWASQAVAHEVHRLHGAGIYTRDLQETNLMLEAADEGDSIRVYFVDLEDFRRVRRVSTKRRLLNLVHLDRSIGRFVSRGQRLRFLYYYLGERPGRAEARRIVGRLIAMRHKADARMRRGHAPASMPGVDGPQMPCTAREKINSV